MGNVARQVARRVSTDVASGTSGAESSSWLTVAGYAALFETVEPSTLVLDTVPTPDEVDSWTDSTGIFTATGGAAKPSFPGSFQANGIDGVDFTGGGTLEYLDLPLGLSSTDEYAAFFAVRIAAVHNGTLCIFSEGGTERILWTCTSGNKIAHYRNNLAAFHASTQSYTTVATARIMIAYSGGNSILRVEGGSEETAAIAAGSHAAGTGRFGMRATSIQDLRGLIYGVAIYGGASGVPGNAAARAQVWADFGARFGL